jgi:hypothetical protein
MDGRQIFEFELDFVRTLRCVPMIVRFKLDTCGVKLSLTHWNRFDWFDRMCQAGNGSVPRSSKAR